MIISWFTLIIEGLLCCLFADAIPENNSVLCTMVILTNSLVVLFETGKICRNKVITSIIWAGFIIRIFLLFWDLNFRDVFLLPNSGLDTESFALWAKSGYLTGDYKRGGIYAQFISIWYRLFGIQRPIAQYINVLLFVTTVYFLLKSMNYLKINILIQKKIVLLLAFLPNFAITNSILLRETLIVCLLTMASYYFVLWIKTNNIIAFGKSVLLVCVSAAIHSGAIAILLGEAIVFVMYDRKSQTIKFHKKSLFSTVLILIGFLILYSKFGNVLFGKFQGIDSATDILNTANRYSVGGSSYDSSFQINNNVVNLIVNTPIRMFYFVTSPLPWSWRGIADLIAFCFSSTVFIYAYYRAYKEVKYKTGKYKTYIIVFIILALSSALIFAWGVSNAGTAVRHREKFIVIYMILIALCEENRNYRRKIE